MQHNQQPDVEYFPNKKPLDIDDTSVTMQPSINESKTQIHVKKARSWFKRINHVLEDKSKKSLTTESDAGSTVVDANSGHHRILKRALNIIFVTIGVFLLLAVIVVIIYTIVIDSQSSSNSTQVVPICKPKNETTPNKTYFHIKHLTGTLHTASRAAKGLRVKTDESHHVTPFLKHNLF
ncbi:uncharacterized protein LOC141909697 isoform X2 [Tubulanus polymorphus]|uniref:uncharacterized protein LOC141909697 isoform X2 n=1 Tax=Tubulanus polymorphus TaxID=672921 RepID=UPI003DA57A06